MLFWRCTFSDNVADINGGAVETLAGYQELRSCDFEGNSADIGGAMRLGGTVDDIDCSFLSNFAYTRGWAVAAVGSANISGSSFEGNQVSCAIRSYRSDTEKAPVHASKQCASIVLLGTNVPAAPSKSGDVTPTYKVPLEHTSADKDGLTLKTFKIDEGYWRATADSVIILACYNARAYRGGETGADTLFAPGYKGPCERECSSSRRQGLLAAALIVAIVVVFAIVTIFRCWSSTELEDRNLTCLHRRVLRAVPVQALKIIVVVWQILTQFTEAANVTYPGVYQDFLSAINIVNFDLGSVLAAGCLWSDTDFHDRLFVSTVGPLVVVGFLAMTYWIAMHRNGESGDTAVVEKIRHKHQTALLLLTFLVYSSVSSTVFQTFACDTLDDDGEYLPADYRIHCTDAKHKIFEVCTQRS